MIAGLFLLMLAVATESEAYRTQAIPEAINTAEKTATLSVFKFNDRYKPFFIKSPIKFYGDFRAYITKIFYNKPQE